MNLTEKSLKSSLIVAVVIVVVGPPTLAAQQTGNAVPTPASPVQDAYPHVSRDGVIVFQSNRLGGWKLFVARPDGSELRQLTSGPGEDVTPIWSPDGTQVVFASDRGGNEDVWIVRADGTGLRNLTNHPASDSHPGWSPDGRLMVFCSTRGDGENDDIYIINVDGSGLQRLTDNGIDWDTFPSFSPDGRTILFRRLLWARTSEGTLGNSEVMVMNTDGTSAVNLTRHPWFDGWPNWSPDGRRIAFSSNRSDAYQIYVMNADGSALTRVVDSPYTDVRPQWLPDGRGLIFNREHDARIEMLQVRMPETPVSPYVAQGSLSIKSLSPEEVDAYLSGKGVGLAKAAELNGYAGPKHVLELASQLGLSPEQRAQTEALFASMLSKATPLGQALVEEERKLDQLFATRAVTPELLATALGEIGSLQAGVRGAHLEAHLAQVKILTPEQNARYARLRGYGSSGEHTGHPDAR